MNEVLPYVVNCRVRISDGFLKLLPFCMDFFMDTVCLFRFLCFSLVLSLSVVLSFWNFSRFCCLLALRACRACRRCTHTAYCEHFRFWDLGASELMSQNPVRSHAGSKCFSVHLCSCLELSGSRSLMFYFSVRFLYWSPSRILDIP